MVEATVELHGTIGPVRTTISAIAEKAAVQRLTVYRHFPDERSLLEAGSSHAGALMPAPDAAVWRAIADPEERVRPHRSGNGRQGPIRLPDRRPRHPRRRLAPAQYSAHRRTRSRGRLPYLGVTDGAPGAERRTGHGPDAGVRAVRVFLLREHAPEKNATRTWCSRRDCW